MNLHKSEEQAEALDLMRMKVNSELLCLKEKTKEELNLWSGLATKFVMIKAFSDHLANTVELIEKQSQEGSSVSDHPIKHSAMKRICRLRDYSSLT